MADTMRGPRRTATPWRLALAASLLTLAGCGDDGAEVDEPLRSSANTSFSVVEHEGGRHVVGHGITMRLPDGWTDYEPEKPSKDGTSHEWAVGLPADTRPLPVGVQFSMGKQGSSESFETLPRTTRELAVDAPGFELLDEGGAEVPGAEDAAFLRFERDHEIDGRTVDVEQLQLVIEMPGGETSVVRFVAEAGKWKQQMQAAYESLVVTERSQG